MKINEFIGLFLLHTSTLITAPKSLVLFLYIAGGTEYFAQLGQTIPADALALYNVGYH